MDRSWFDAMATDARARPDTYRRLGFADLRLVVEERDGDETHRFGLVLDGYDVESTGELTNLSEFRPDATISGPSQAWEEMAANIHDHHGADGAHTLNALSIAGAPLRVSSNDPVGRDRFFRYAETLQTLFDSMAAAPVGH
jgi:hypothetical protein